MDTRIIALFPLFFVFLIPAAAGLGTPAVTFIPENVSADSSFIMLVDPGAGPDESVWISWISWSTPDMLADKVDLDYYYGLFPKVGDRWFCYFSNTDPKSNCGPSPFPQPGDYGKPGLGSPYPVDVTAINQYGDKANTTLYVPVGGIELDTVLTVENKTVSMIVRPDDFVDSVSYTVYDANFSDFLPPQDLTPELPYYSGNTTLDGGEYYITFFAESSDDFGSAMERIEIAAEGGPGPYIPTTEYQLETDPVTLEILINKNQEWSYTVPGERGVKNTGNETLGNLTTSVPSAFSSYLSISLDNTTLEPNDVTRFTINLENVDQSMEILTNVEIKDNSGTVGVIPIDILVSVMGEGMICPTPAIPGTVSIQPATWTGDYLAGETASRTFTIKNNANQTLEDMDWSWTGSSGVVDDVSLPSSISPNDQDSIEVSASSSSPGKESGEIVIETDTGSVSILVALEFFENVSDEIENLDSGLSSIVTGLTDAQLDLLSDTIDNIQYLIDGAESDFSAGRYAEAKSSADAAAAGIAVLQSVTAVDMGGGGAGGGGEIDWTLIITIIIVVVIVAAAAYGIWYYLKNIRGRAKPVEEELEEEY